MNKTEKIEALESSLSSTKKLLEQLGSELKTLKQEAAQFEYLSKAASGYAICSDSDVVLTSYDVERAGLGNHFQKKSHAEAKAAHMLKYGRLQQLVIEFNAEHCNGWVADWGDKNQEKGELYFNRDDSVWSYSVATVCETPGIMCFDASQKGTLLELVNKHFPPDEWVKL